MNRHAISLGRILGIPVGLDYSWFLIFGLITSTMAVMIPVERTKRVKPDAELRTALEEMDRYGVNQPPMMVDGQIQGMLGQEDVITFLRTLQELGT
jgi:CBS domain-containing protein